jgi:hypothetical protein
MMALFARKAPEPEAPKGGGLEVLRAKAKAHARHVQGHCWLRDALRVSGHDLDAFLGGGPARFEIPLLLDYLGLRATYDPATDLLKSTAPPPTSAGVPPSPYQAKPFTPSTQSIGLGCYPPPVSPRPEGAPQAPRPDRGWA